MAYELYSTENVFKSAVANILCNKILDHIFNQFPGSEIKLVATLDLAKIIQGAALIELPVIPFVTNDPVIYGYLVKNLQQIITVQNQISFTNRIQVVTSAANFEFWLDATYVNYVNVFGIYARNINELT